MDNPNSHFEMFLEFRRDGLVAWKYVLGKSLYKGDNYRQWSKYFNTVSRLERKEERAKDRSFGVSACRAEKAKKKKKKKPVKTQKKRGTARELQKIYKNNNQYIKEGALLKEDKV